jgi:16S rRNA (cytosine967-C5)-methyltransferase
VTPRAGGRGRGARPAPGPPRVRRPVVDPARQAAYEAIAAVHRDDAYANLVLPRILTERRVSGRDAAFATELAYGALRMRGTLDAVIAAAAGRDVERIDPPARDALRLGVYQLLRTRVPPHAATSTTVDLVRLVAPGAIGFANAVLRTVGARSWDEWVAALAPPMEADPIGHLAFAHAHPPWIVRAVNDALGATLAETALALAADNEPPVVHLCARPGRTTAAQLAAEVGGVVAPFGPYAVHLPAGSPGELAAVADGRAHVQDEGSQLVAGALAAAPVDGRDERWLDLCAGPGGKAALLGGLAAAAGARLTAVEIAPHRADLVARAVRGFPVDVVCADGREITGEYDRVLVDAPCTGLGALRRRPEARWRRRPADLPPLTRLQRELLGAALRVVRPGGVVAYATCSPHVAETRVTVGEAVRRAAVGTEPADARPLLPTGMPVLGDGPTVQLWPHRHGTDAMFLALLHRTD